MKRQEVFLLVFALSLNIHKISAQFSGKKCCGDSQVFDVVDKKCISTNQTLGTSVTLRLLSTQTRKTQPKEFILEENSDDDGISISCDPANQFPYTNITFIVYKASDWVLFFQKHRRYQDPGQYCLDFLQTEDGTLTSGAVVCDCMDEPCISMCTKSSGNITNLTPHNNIQVPSFPLDQQIQPELPCKMKETVDLSLWRVEDDYKVYAENIAQNYTTYCFNVTETGTLELKVCPLNLGLRSFQIVKVSLCLISFISLSLIVLASMTIKELRQKDGWKVQLGIFFNFMINFLVLFISNVKNFTSIPKSCVFIGLLLQFTGIFAFSCMTALSYTLWSNLSSMQMGSSKSLVPLMCAAVVPTLMTCITAGLQFSQQNLNNDRLAQNFYNLTDSVKQVDLYPGIGKNSCFIYGLLPRILYFELPNLILLCVNFFLFGNIIYILFLGKFKASSKINSKLNMRNRLMLSLRIFFLMGLNWSMETLLIVLRGFGVYGVWTVVPEIINSSTGLFLLLSYVSVKGNRDVLAKHWGSRLGLYTERRGSNRTTNTPVRLQTMETK